MANTDRAAGVTRTYTDPHGNGRGTGESVTAGRGFLAAPVDATGLVQIGARYYDPVAGTFISVDPLLDPTLPAQFNAYVYSGNNPATWSDPTGRAWQNDPDRPQGTSLRPPGKVKKPNSPVAPVAARPQSIADDWYGYEHKLMLAMTDMTSADIMQSIRSKFGLVFPPIAFAEPSTTKLEEVGQELDTRLAGIPLEGVTSGRIRVTAITETSYTIVAEEGHPENPGEVKFSISKRNDVAYLEVDAKYEDLYLGATPDWAYSMGTSVLWSGYASRIRHEILGVPVQSKPSPRF